MSADFGISVAPAALRPKPLRFVRDALAHASRQLLAVALSLGFLRWLSIAFGSMLAGDGLTRYVCVRLPVALSMSLVFLPAILLAEQSVRQGASRSLSYLLAVVPAAILYGLLSIALFVVFNGGFKPPWYRFTFFCADALMRGGMAALVYSNYQRLRLARQRLHEAELERTEASRRIAEMRLHALEARVDLPQLFDELARVRDLYPLDPHAADRALDTLTTRLRAATRPALP